MKAKAKVESVIKVQFTLTVDEANMLKGMMQNPLYDQTLEGEDPIQREVREAIWQALDDIQ